MDIKEGDTVSFRYKGGRFVKGIVTITGDSWFEIVLKTDYIGKTVEWFIGEKKLFNIKECKKFTNWSR